MADAACDDAVEQLAALLDQVEAPLKKTFEVWIYARACFFFKKKSRSWFFLISEISLLLSSLGICSILVSAFGQNLCLVSQFSLAV